MDKKKIRKIILPLVVLIIIIGGVYLFKERGQNSINVLELYGNVDIRQIQLAFHDTGRIKTISVREGDRVKAGQMVAEIDDSRYRATLQQLEGEVEAKKQTLARLEAGSRSQEIKQAQAKVKSEEARVRDAEITYQRLGELIKDKYVSKQKLDDALAILTASKEALKSAQEGLDLTITGPRKEEIKAAIADHQAKLGALAYARQELNDTKLYAPANGIVQDRIMEPGDMAFPATAVLTIALNNPLWIRAYIPEPALGKIRLGMLADITTDSFSGKIYKGWIGFISPTAEFTPKNVETSELRTRLVYQVRVYACNSSNELRLGMPATITIHLDQPATGNDISSPAVCEEKQP